MSRNAEPTRIVVAGDINPDLIFYGLPREIPEEREILASNFVPTLGGSAAIMAHNLAMLGSQVSLIARLGSDFLGCFCRERLSAAGVKLDGVQSSHSPTGVTAILAHGPTRHILTYQGSVGELLLRDFDLDAIASARHFHISSPFLQPKLLADLPFLLRTIRACGLTISIDSNDDPAGRWEDFLDRVVPEVDILFCTSTELERMTWNRPEPERAPERVAGRVPILAVKRGAAGVSIFAKGRCIDLPGVLVDAVDTVGAGDSFDAGFLHMWLSGASLDDCGRFANIVGALSVTRAGGTEALRDETHRQSFLAKYGFATHGRIANGIPHGPSTAL